MSRENQTTRARILSATISLLESGSAPAVRMSDIAKASGISRQALYLHFPNRADLLVAAVRHLDETHQIDARLAPSRAAADGVERLREWVSVWADYIPQIYGVAKALLALQHSDAEARAAWQDRMAAVRHGCAAVITALENQGRLTDALSPDEATDLLATLLSVHGWEQLHQEANWSQQRYVEVMQQTAARILLAN